MTGEGRRSAGFGDALSEFSADEWAPEEKPAKPRPDRAATRESAGLVGFRSRDPVEPTAASAADAPVSSKQRRWRTGRNVQFNVRATPETIAAFTAIADANGWSLGETFEKATESLARERGSGKRNS